MMIGANFGGGGDAPRQLDPVTMAEIALDPKAFKARIADLKKAEDAALAAVKSANEAIVAAEAADAKTIAASKVPAKMLADAAALNDALAVERAKFEADKTATVDAMGIRGDALDKMEVELRNRQRGIVDREASLTAREAAISAREADAAQIRETYLAKASALRSALG